MYTRDGRDCLQKSLVCVGVMEALKYRLMYSLEVCRTTEAIQLREQ